MNLQNKSYETEYRSGYRVSGDAKKIWAVNLDLLEAFQKICEKHGLKYFLGFGTLLGAYRHGGFIPWDDDVDILMPRKDFEKLKSLYKEIMYPYFLQSSISDPFFWHRGMMKFRRSDTTCIEKRNFGKPFNQGIGIEIIPIDNCSDATELREKQSREVSVFQRLLWAKIYRTDYHQEGEDDKKFFLKKNAIKWFIYCGLAKFINRSFLEKQIFKASTKYNSCLTKYCTTYTSYGWRYPLLFCVDFKKTIPMEFEHLILPAPVGFWRCLEIQYGKDFIKCLPPINDKSKHPAFWDVEEGFDIYQKRFFNVFEKINGKRIVLFGTGNMVHRYKEDTKGKYMPEFFVDNNPKLWNSKVGNILVKKPEAILEIPEQQRHVIICNNYFRQIGRQLKQLGVEEYFIYTDNFSILFGSPNTISMFEQKDEIYKVGLFVWDYDSINKNNIALLKHAKLSCEHLIVGIVCKAENIIAADVENMSELRELRCVDNVIIIDYISKNTINRYHFDCIFMCKSSCNDIIDPEIDIDFIESGYE